MKKLHISKAVVPAQLSRNALDTLTDELYTIHSQIFSGVDKASFRSYVIEPDTVLTKLFLVQNRQNETVGYLSFQVYQPSVMRSNKRHQPYVFRSELGILPAFRGQANLNQILFWEALKFYILKGMPEAYFMATPVNPVAYYLTCRDIALVWPQPDRKTPSHINSIEDELSLSLGIPNVSESNRRVKKVGWVVKMPPAQIRRLTHIRNPWIEYFLKENPGFREGNGLMWIAPASLKNGILSALKMGNRKLKYKLARLAPKVSGILNSQFLTLNP